MRHAKDFLEIGNKVKVTCMFRGREMAHKDIGERLIRKVVEDLKEIAVCETPMKMFGRFLTVVLAPHKNKK